MLIIKMKVIMLINKQVRLVFVEGDENASNGIKNISSKALIGDCINMPVIVQVSARIPATYYNIVSSIYSAFSKDESVQLRDIYVEDCVFASGDNISMLSCILKVSKDLV